ncbi:archease [Candidatus Woesearchaeota archaeon]|nr:archease [Candidatus Woesearchaeota archaeon]MBW2994154.1 archease [Candidatus Woesearchaeota archaeon]
MKKFDILEHTADGKFRAYGKDLEEQFGNAVLAMFSFMFDLEHVKAKIKKKVHLKGKDEKALLYNWLEEFLALLDIDAFIPKKIEEIKIQKTADGFEINAIVLGDSIGEQEHIGSVKAMTYAEMEITDKYVQVVVDL